MGLNHERKGSVVLLIRMVLRTTISELIICGDDKIEDEETKAQRLLSELKVGQVQMTI